MNGLVEKQIEIDGRTVTYAESNPKAQRTLVLLHGFRANYKGLLPLADKLGGYRIILLDLPGYGGSQPLPHFSLRSYADFLHQFTQQLRLKDFIFFGHSFGGTVGLAYASHYPDDAAGFILAGPVTYTNTFAAHLANLYYLVGYWLRGRARDIWLRRKATTLITTMFLLKTKDKTVRRFIIRDDLNRLGEMNPDVVIDTSRVYRATDFDQLAGKVTVPVLILAGDKDNVAPMKETKRLASNLMKSSLQVLPHRGHISCVEHPEETARVMQHWIGDTYGR